MAQLGEAFVRQSEMRKSRERIVRSAFGTSVIAGAVILYAGLALDENVTTELLVALAAALAFLGMWYRYRARTLVYRHAAQGLLVSRRNGLTITA